MHRGREDEYGKTQCVLLHYVCMYVCMLNIVVVASPSFCREEGAGVINFCMKECCTG